MPFARNWECAPGPTRICRTAPRPTGKATYGTTPSGDTRNPNSILSRVGAVTDPGALHGRCPPVQMGVMRPAGGEALRSAAGREASSQGIEPLGVST